MTAIHFSHFKQYIEMFLTNFAHVFRLFLVVQFLANFIYIAI